MLGVHHGAELKASDAKHGGRSSTPRSSARWPVSRGPPNSPPTSPRSPSTISTCAKATSTRASIWSRSPQRQRSGRQEIDRLPLRRAGQFTLVLHSHLPWLAHHGRWPVGEEWLYQSWAASYLPLVGAEKPCRRRSFASAQPRHHAGARRAARRSALPRRACTTGWATGSCAPTRRRCRATCALGAHEHRLAGAALADFEQRWRHGGSPVWRSLIDADAIELLGGPLAHPFQPLLDPRLRQFQLTEGLADARRAGAPRRPGIWAPECGYTPGMERGYAAAGVTHFMVDGPRCAATPPSAGRSAIPTSSPSAATCR